MQDIVTLGNKKSMEGQREIEGGKEGGKERETERERDKERYKKEPDGLDHKANTILERTTHPANSQS